MAIEAIVVGSGFAGAVTVARLAMAGYRVTLLERGRRYPQGSFPPLPRPDELLPDHARWTWDADQGLYEVRDLGPIRSVQAAGYGGGSLVYANVHLRADETVLASWPARYRRSQLDPYYDRAAAMLDVRPYPTGGQAVKGRALATIASTLGRPRFAPPLAVNFEAQVDELGAKRPACTDCGACCTGCNVGAKNTLDTNYLAYAEEAGAEVRTLTEVVRIEREGHRFRVRCKDHLRGGAELVLESRYVFLCAGAVHTTRLLFASGLGNDERGAGFFGNGDAIGMVYETHAPLEPTSGPTITEAMVCEVPAEPSGHPPPRPRWFMIQDGGYTESLDRAFGLLRAPALGDRNRFRERPRGRPPAPAPTPGPRPRPASVADVRGGVLASLSTALLRGVDDPRFGLERAGGETNRRPGPIVPRALRALGRLTRLRLRSNERRVVGDTIAGLPERFAAAYLATTRPRRRGLGRAWIVVDWSVAHAGACLLRAMRAMRSVNEALTVASAQSFEHVVGLDLRRSALLERWLSRALGLEAAADGGDEPRHRMMLLAMGDDRDDPRELSYTEEAGLVAKNRGKLELYGHEERMMRRVARALRGELRVNPMYVLERETVTVHGQGGARMTTDHAPGVTDASGEVLGCPGLYVMDAAAFPTPVGVNPSATILAVAERKVSDFMVAHPPIHGPTPAQLELARRAAHRVLAWTRAHGANPFDLAPPARSTHGIPVDVEPVGLRFSEVMRGFVAPATEVPSTDADYVAYEARGRDRGRYVELHLTATIRDVVSFREDPTHRVELRGQVVRSDAPGDPIPLDPDGSALYLLTGAVSGAAQSDTMRYWLEDGKGFVLKGFKFVEDGEGFDAWEDTTRLFVHLREGGVDYFGIVRLSLEDFAQRMLPSFEVTGTPDRARQAWAIAAFAGFFFSRLQRVYLPDAVTKLLASIGVR